MALDDPQVNEEWNCDKGRWAFQYSQAPAAKRITSPLIRDRETGELRPASWPEALAFAADGLNAARGRAAALVGGRLTLEDAYAYAKFTRIALETNDIDFRARPHSEEEAEFLASLRRRRPGLATTYADLDARPGRAARRLRAGGGVADRLPAAAQERARPQAGGRGHSAVRHARAGQAQGRAAEGGAAHRAGVPGGAGRRRPGLRSGRRGPEDAPRTCASPER